ncbi:hypothetical protein BH09PAT1_BH09PAT1_0510 [soil metagenome]
MTRDRYYLNEKGGENIMTNIKIKLATSIATATLLAATFAPATFAATSITVHGNLKNSVNIAGATNTNKTTVKQTNNNAVFNLTGVFQNTGNNKSSDNGGKGDVTVKSKAANSTVTNTTTTGGNSAVVTPCGCDNGGDSLTISGNGKNSTNIIGVTNSNTTSVTQTNNTLVVNGTIVSQNTGGNKANDNMGNGDVTVTSGQANSTVTNTVTTGGNSLTL